MKVKQLLNHFWHGASEIDLIRIYRCSNWVGTITREELTKRNYHGYDADSVNSFQIKDRMMKIFIK